MGHFSSRKQKLPGISKLKFGYGNAKLIVNKVCYLFDMASLKPHRLSTKKYIDRNQLQQNTIISLEPQKTKLI
jgi:hypothetical protein